MCRENYFRNGCEVIIIGLDDIHGFDPLYQRCSVGVKTVLGFDDDGYPIFYGAWTGISTKHFVDAPVWEIAGLLIKHAKMSQPLTNGVTPSETRVSWRGDRGWQIEK